MALLDDIIAFYDLGNDADDDSGNGNHGTNTGVSFDGTNGDFDGTGDHISLGASLFGGTNCSISLWVTPDDIATYHAMFSCYTSDANSFECFIHSEGVDGQVFAMNYDAGLRSPVAALSNGVLAHLAVTYNGTTGRLYIDGTEVDNATCAFSTLTPVSYLGARGGSSNRYDGKMRCMGAWDRELTSGDVTQLYNSGTPMTWATMAGGGGTVRPRSLLLTGVGC